MKKLMMLLVILFTTDTFIHANPIDATPIALFSELVFDETNNWTMELYFTYGFGYDGAIDSIVVRTSLKSARLNSRYRDGKEVGVFTTDSLSTPLTINREGDKIVLYTYSTYSSNHFIRMDSIMFGNYEEATVGQPLPGFSIMRLQYKYSMNRWTIDCLTQNPSLDVLNSNSGIGATMKGHIYDVNNRIVAKLKVFPVSATYFVFETPVFIDSSGLYTTQIFPTVWDLTKLTVRMVDFTGWKDTVEIERLLLPNVHPDTTFMRDIYLNDDRYVVTSITSKPSFTEDDLTVINYPNPFNLSTNFFIKVPAGLKNSAGSIAIFNAGGQIIRTISIKGGGSVSWDGTDARGNVISSGVYYYHLTVNNQLLKSGSLVLLK